MKNTQYAYHHVYGFIRNYYLSALPQEAPCEPHAIMNAHLKAAGSTLVMAKPGMSQGSSDEHRSEIEKFLLDSTNRNNLYDDIKEMTNWLYREGYLHFNGTGNQGKGAYKARDLLVRTPSLNFELRS